MMSASTSSGGPWHPRRTPNPRSVTKAPKIQRLVTPTMLQRKRHKRALKRARLAKNKEESTEYAKLLATRVKEAKEKRQAELKRRRSSMRDSKPSAASAPAAPAPKPAAKPAAKKADPKKAKSPAKGGAKAAAMKKAKS